MELLLPVMLLAPFLGVLVLMLVPAHREDWVRRISVFCATVSLACAGILYWNFDVTATGYPVQFRLDWVPELGISFHLGVDGISVALALLNAVVLFAGCLISYAIVGRVREFYIFFLLLGGGVFGVFLCVDLFFLYFFYELAVIPMYPLIGIWGSGRKEYATMYLTLYLTCGALLALGGLLALYFLTGGTTFNLIELKELLVSDPTLLSAARQKWIFPLLLFGFGAIAPMWPMHTWSPGGHAAAPSAVSMMHAGVLMKLGSYAIIRIGLWLLPEGAPVWLDKIVIVFCSLNIIYGGLVAVAQKDMKFIIGYSSSSHMGYVLLGIAAVNVISLTGAVYLMFVHGVMTALAFSLIGFFYDQIHTRMLPDLGGMAKKIPFIAACFMICAMASAGLPGFGNFVAELLVMIGSWDRYPVATGLAVWGVVISALYLLRTVRTAFFGPLAPKCEKLADAPTAFARFPFIFMIAVLVVTGFYPSLLTRPIEAGVKPIAAQYQVTKPSSGRRIARAAEEVDSAETETRVAMQEAGGQE